MIKIDTYQKKKYFNYKKVKIDFQAKFLQV